MKDKYTAPVIKIEELENEDILCFSDNDTTTYFDLVRSIAEDVFGTP